MPLQQGFTQKNFNNIKEKKFTQFPVSKCFYINVRLNSLVMVGD